MDNLTAELTDGQIQISMNEATFNEFTLEDAGVTDTYQPKGGNLRIQIDLGYIQDFNFYKMPVVKLNYTEKIQESEWIVEFNGMNILEKKDHSGEATILLLNRNKMKELVRRHENTLLIHGDFSGMVELKKDSSFQLLEEPGE